MSSKKIKYKNLWAQWIVYGIFGLMVILLIPVIFCPDWGIYKNIERDLTIKLLTLIAVSIGAWRGIKEFRNASKWKRVEFLANEYKKFLDDPYVHRTFIMLDGYMLIVPVNKNEVDGKQEFIDFNTELLIKALMKVDKETIRGKEEAYIRLCIDKFLFKLGLFQTYYESKLVTVEQLKYYFDYWIKIVGDKDDKTIDNRVKIELHRFIIDFDYIGTLELLKLFGYDLKSDNSFKVAQEKVFSLVGKRISDGNTNVSNLMEDIDIGVEKYQLKAIIESVIDKYNKNKGIQLTAHNSS